MSNHSNTTDIRNKEINGEYDFLFLDKSESNSAEENDIKYLTIGAPGPDLLKICFDYFKLAIDDMQSAKRNNYEFFQYGPNPGTLEFRRQLARFLSNEYGDCVRENDLIMTSGASYGLHLILSSLVDMDAVVFVEEVTYMVAICIINQFPNMKVIPVPMLETGVDINAFRRLVAKHLKSDVAKSGNKLFSSLYYTIPNFHNPTGIVFSEETCKYLIKLSREHNMLIACDDVYNLLHNTNGFPAKRLFAYDKITDPDYKGTVISNGTFSKILSPGIRVGWMECPPYIMDEFCNTGVIMSAGAANNYTSGIVISLIRLGLAEQALAIYRHVYTERMEVVCNILEANLPTNCSFSRPSGGYFIWIRLPVHCNASELNEFCRQKFRVAVCNGEHFSIIRGGFKNYFRITIGYQKVEVLRVATEKICEALHIFLK